MHHRRLMAGTLLALLAPMVFATGPAAPVTPSPTYVGSTRCIGCHAAQAAAWRTSHHAQAMQAATSNTVLGDFSGIRTVQLGEVERFFRRDDRFYALIRTPGQLTFRTLQIRYTFGAYPLQQYLVDGPRGRFQALTVAWDARATKAGGQRWFSLHPGGLAAGDALQWNGRDSNWNFMCADCHSTNLRRNYSAADDGYRTTWSDLDVACEACHGPGSVHVRWARDGARPGSDTGLTVTLRASRTVQWGLWSPTQRIATLHGARGDAEAQTQVCFPCHARRQALTDGTTAGQPLLDHYLPQLLEPSAYHPDGQIDAEDFEFGSFVQSRMFSQGVTCTNCHDAHSLELKASGNAVCTQCHRADVFDVSSHHHHAPQTDAARCVSCHMPQKTYMGVDARRDHSFRIPQPALTAAIGTPNACGACHPGQNAAWADAAIAHWTAGRTRDSSVAVAFDDAWSGASATSALLKVIGQPLAPIVRASALAAIAGQSAPASREIADVLAAAVKDREPLVRLGAARGIAALEPAAALQIGTPLLSDPLKAIRVEAARSLVGSVTERTSPALRARLQTAVDELVASEQVAAERPESHVNLAQIQARQRRPREAQRQLQEALRLDPRFVPAMVNLADLYRAQDQDAEAERWLRRAMQVAPTAAEPVHALGLLEVRRGHVDSALNWLGKAVALDGATARYAYVYAVALSESGQRAQALGLIESARRRSPKDESLRQLQRDLEGNER